MADGQFIQIAPVTLRLHQGTARETVITALYALDNLGSVWKLIDQDGHNVNSVDNGRDAREALAGHSYDVILTDFRMPEMTGEDLCRRIERGWPHLAPRVVFVTPDPAPGFQTQYGGAPVPVLTKPYTPERLRRAMASVIARDV